MTEPSSATRSDRASRQLGPFFKMRGFVAIRAFGWQFDVTDHRKLPRFLSERYGYGPERYRHIGPFCFRNGRLRSWSASR